MGPRTRLMIVLAGLCWASAAAAAEPTPVPKTVEELIVTAPKTISELIVTAKLKCLAPDRIGNPGDRPKVVSSFPARGAVVRPGLVVVRVTFDQPMACSGRFLPRLPWPNPCPGGGQDMLLSFDRKTVRTACETGPDGHYGLSLNPTMEGDLFFGLGGLPAETYGLDFTTSAGPPVASVCAALAQDAWTVRQMEQRHRKLDCSAAPVIR